MNKDKDLFTHLQASNDIIKRDCIHHTVSSTEIHVLVNTIELAFQGGWSVRRIKVKSCISICSNELSNIFI